MNAPSNPTLLTLQGATRTFARRAGPWRRPDTFTAVHPTDLIVQRGEIVGLVGESGSGKTTLGQMAAGTLRPSGGQRRWLGLDLDAADRAAAAAARLAVQMVWQDAGDALDPRLSVADSVAEAPRFHGLWRRDEQERCVADLLNQVGLDARLAAARPATLSGGQRARVNIARALALAPALLVADEPTAALDVSVQAQIASLLLALRAERQLAILLISHDLALMGLLADRVLVMHAGRVVEQGPVEAILTAPHHPYTARLVDDAGLVRHGNERRALEPSEPSVPSRAHILTGCPFATQCPLAQAQCKIDSPVLRSVGTGHASACRLDPISR